jgi:hypothetical protein
MKTRKSESEHERLLCVGQHYITVSQYTVQKTKFANAEQGKQIYQ